MKPTETWRILRDTALIVAGLALVIAGLLWLAWLVDFGITRTTFVRAVACLIFAGFALFLVLLVVLVASERSNHYAGEPTSRLHLPLIVSTAALACYFGIASISAVDVFYEPRQRWPLLSDPTVQLLTSALILAIVAAKAWMLWEILPRRRDWLEMPPPLKRFLRRGE